ncbi:MAG: c-type cytochrome [Sulfurimonadaceae bacterium]
MKKRWLIMLLLSATTLLTASKVGAQLSEEKCTSCHMTSSSSAKLKDGKMGAPPMWGVMKKVKNHFKTEEDGIAFIIDYTMDPSEEKMLFPEATKEYFGLMPSMRETVTDEEMKIIAEYLYR